MTKAIIIKKPGGPEVLEITNIKLEAPGPDQIKVKNIAIGLNYIDTYHRSGLYPVQLPSGIGLEGAGKITEIGSNVIDLNIGDNCFILENQTIQPTVKIGDNVMIWSTNHLGHNCEIKDHAYLASGITVSGHTIIGERTFVGVNAAFKDFIDIGSDCFITMGANIVKNIPNDSTATSNDLFESDNIVNKKLKRKYFGLDYELE